jgi:hypothetical protein
MKIYEPSDRTVHPLTNQSDRVRFAVTVAAKRGGIVPNPRRAVNRELAGLGHPVARGEIIIVIFKCVFISIVSVVKL